MNKYDFKSAYNKIVLSDDFKRKALEKLTANTSFFEAVSDNSVEEYAQHAVEIKLDGPKHTRIKAAVGIVSAAAVVALCVVGGRYLLHGHYFDKLLPAYADETEEQSDGGTDFLEETHEVSEEIEEENFSIDADGNYVIDKHFGSAYVVAQQIQAYSAPEYSEEYNRFDTALEAAVSAIDFSGLHGITLIGNVSNGTEYEYPTYPDLSIDLNSVVRFNSKVMGDYTIDAENSIYNEDGISLRYIGDNGEFYINLSAFGGSGSLERYVTDNDGNIYTAEGQGMLSVVMSEEDCNSHNFINSESGYRAMFIAGKRVEGVNYFYAYRKTGDSSDDLSISISAKGCTMQEFLDIIAALVQNNTTFSTYNGYTDIGEYEVTAVETEQGTVVINQGAYLGTGAGVSYDVMSNVNDYSEYTIEDALEFTGTESFIDPPLPFDAVTKTLEYDANYAEFHDGYNIMLFYEGKPLEGESEYDEDFIEAQNYLYGHYCYFSDKISYFDDKTPIVRKYSVSYCGDNGEVVDITALKGDFGIRYMGHGFLCLPAEASDLCGDYYIERITEYGESYLSRVYVSKVPMIEQMNSETYMHYEYYAGFYKDGIYYTITTKNVEIDALAKIIAELYTG